MYQKIESYHTEGSSHNQDRAKKASFSSHEQNNTISQRFKEFLIENSATFRRTQRSSTVNPTVRINPTPSLKKSAIYNKLLNSSSDKCTLVEEMARYRQKFENVARKGVKQINSVISRQFWEEQQRKSMTQRFISKDPNQLYSDERYKSKHDSDFQSFEGFVLSQKKHSNKKIVAEAYNLISIEAIEPINTEGALVIAGNQKQLKQKSSRQVFRRLTNRRSKAPLTLQDQQSNPELFFEQYKSVQIGDPQDRQSNKTCCQQSIRRVQPRRHAKIPMNGRYCFKNLYSGNNGIQIKYLSIEQGLENSVSGQKMVIRGTPTRQLGKRNKKIEVEQSSIVFKKNNKKKDGDAMPVQGWIVQQDFNQDHDLCPH